MVCLPSFDIKVLDIARSITTILILANVDFSVFGKEEECCSIGILRIGERGFFNELERDILSLLDLASLGDTRISTKTQETC